MLILDESSHTWHEYMSIEGSSEPVRLHVSVTHMVSAIRSSFFSALHFLRRWWWFLPLVSTLLLSCFAKQVLLYSGRLLCNLLFSSKARAARSGPSSSEKNETTKRILIGDVAIIICRFYYAPVSFAVSSRRREAGSTATFFLRGTN